MIIINSNTRQFNIPGAELVFGVTADSETERKQFQCPRFVGNNLDLASCFIRINYRNANGKTDFYLVDDMVIDGDNITFSWLLSPKVTEYRGQIKFVMCAIGPDLKLKWHTTQGTGQVMEGLEPDNSHVVSQTADVVAQIISMVEAQTSTVEKVGGEQVVAVKTTAKTAQDGAVTAIETAGAAVKASIPADYTALSDAVRKTAPGIVCHADGEVITLSDASDNPLRGLRIFGKSTQDGIPTPENPVEIVSIENPTISVDEQTLSVPLALPGIPVTSGGNYTDANGQQWICDEVDFELGTYIRRVGIAVFDGTRDLYSVEELGETMRWLQSVNESSNQYTLGNIDGFFSHGSYAHNYSAGTMQAYVAKGNVIVRFPSSLVGTTEESIQAYEVSQYNAGTPLTVVYPLEVPIKTPLSETELAAYRALHTNKPNTTILNDSGAYMSVDYTADTKLYIDNKIKEALL